MAIGGASVLAYSTMLAAAQLFKPVVDRMGWIFQLLAASIVVNTGWYIAGAVLTVLVTVGGGLNYKSGHGEGYNPKLYLLNPKAWKAFRWQFLEHFVVVGWHCVVPVGVIAFILENLPRLPVAIFLVVNVAIVSAYWAWGDIHPELSYDLEEDYSSEEFVKAETRRDYEYHCKMFELGYLPVRPPLPEILQPKSDATPSRPESYREAYYAET